MAITLNGTTGITDVNGTAAAPAITGTDTDTGVFFGTNTVSLSTNGTERLQVDASGNAGLGVTPSAWISNRRALQIGGQVVATLNYGAAIGESAYNFYYNSGGSAIYQNNGYAAHCTFNNQTAGGFAWGLAASGTAGNAITFTQAMTLDASGNLGIGTTSPSAKLQVSNGTVTVDINPSGSNFYFGPSTNHPIIFNTNNTERARISSTGNWLVGTTSAVTSGGVGFAVQADGNGAFLARRTDLTTSNTVAYWYNPNGIVGSISTNGSATTYSTSSDYRLKENVQPMTGALATVSQLKPCTYTWKADGAEGQGFIAHELQEVVPDAVTGEKDAVNEDGSIKPQGIDTSFLVATLTAAIQEQQAIIQQLQADVAALKAK